MPAKKKEQPKSPKVILPALAPGEVGKLTTAQVFEALDAVIIVDGRSKGERRLKGIIDSVTFNPRTKGNEFPRNKPIVTVSWFGRRSLVLAYALRKQGFKVYDMEGGLFRWILEKRPAVQLFD
jgi:rhodanese-related sulfurtransferase